MLKNTKGFTLMEMLIVVAIIAILVAIAIPTFNSSMEKSRLSADEANVMAAYAEATVDFMDGVDLSTGKNYTCGGVTCTAKVTDEDIDDHVVGTGSNTIDIAAGSVYLESITGVQAKTTDNKIGFYYDGTYYNLEGDKIG